MGRFRTGELSEPRSFYKKLIELNGDKMVGSVSKSTHALVTDNPDSNSSKAKKARALGIKIMSEDDLMAYLTK
jgi:NAD-dependent DNA ligase